MLAGFPPPGGGGALLGLYKGVLKHPRPISPGAALPTVGWAPYVSEPSRECSKDMSTG